MDFDDFPAPTDEAPAMLPPEPLLPDPEPQDALSEFNKKFSILIDERRAKEVDVEKSYRVKAGEELSQWGLQRTTRLNAKKEKNRSEEQVLLESLESEVEGSNTWERVTKMVDLATESTDAKKSDNTRMKKLFIQLKNEPVKAN